MRAQRLGAVGPDVHDQAGAVGAEVGEDAVVLVGEADDLAPAEAGAQLGHRVAPGAEGGTSCSTAVASEGNRFSKTTTW